MMGIKKAGMTGLFGEFGSVRCLSRLRESLDALGAKSLANEFVSILNLHNLKVRTKLTPRSAHRKAAHITKLRLFAAMFANSHRRWPQFCL
jgi:hypothetical protein